MLHDLLITSDIVRGFVGVLDEFAVLELCAGADQDGDGVGFDLAREVRLLYVTSPRASPCF